MGTVYHAVTIMQSLILVCLAAHASATLVYYHNGAVAPLDPNVEAAKADHFKALAEAGAGYAGPAYGAAAVGVSHPLVYGAPLVHHLGKREADADAYYGYAGYGYGLGHLGYAGYYGHAAGLPASAAGLVTYANGATVPVEPLANQVARANHIAAKWGRKKREAQFFYGGLPYAHHAYVPYVAPFVHHPASGAVVPLETADVVAARHAHLAEVAKQIVNGGVPEVPAAEE